MLRLVKTECGLVRGIPAADPRITAFKGIPFAAPPVGENRWRAPQPATPWEGEYKAYAFAPISMQRTPGLNPDNIYSREWNVDPDIAMSEDCLYLNIWAPAKAADEKLPVFVWYFGGGLQEGNTTEMEFDGERLARRGIVVVTVNYRLNVFGLFAHPEITAEAPEAPTNFSHLDQQYGTRWVKRNIPAFGGDPNNITIGGQSAGGGSVTVQLTVPENEGLFQKAVIMSGFFASAYGKENDFWSGAMPIRPLAEVEQSGVEFFKFLGLKTLAEARKLDAFYIRDKYPEFRTLWSTCDDGVFQVGHQYDNLFAGKRLKVPLFIGHTTNEFLVPPRVKTMDEFTATVKNALGDNADKFLALCGSNFDDAIKTSSVCSVELAIRALKRREEALGIDTPYYYYISDHEMPGWDNPGAFHSSDLWFWFETLAKCWRPFNGKHYDLGRQMCNYLANFIKSGNPNGLDNDETPMPEWLPYNDRTPNAMQFTDSPAPIISEPDERMALLVDSYLTINKNAFR